MLQNKKKLILFVIGAILLYLFIERFLGIQLLSIRVPQTERYDIGGLPAPQMMGKIAQPNFRSMPQIGGGMSDSIALGKPDYILPNNSAPNPPTQDRIVIRSGNVSLVVKNVIEARTKITQEVENSGGYVISSYIYNPQDAPNVNLSLRVPAAKFEQTLSFIRGLGLKVSSENVTSQDVTDEFIDLEGRLKSAQATKLRFLEILEKAVTVEDILRVQTELKNIQTEIEQLTGRMDYLKKTGQFALIQVYLATDEAELPYLPPSEKWRPDVALKQAIRSLSNTLKDLSYKAIWLVVYSVILIPTLIILYLLKRRFFTAPPVRTPN